MMKRWLVLCSVFFAVSGVAQPLNNEWIDYSKTYFKFKIGTTGLYRINKAALPVDYLNTPAEQFQLWRNGQQVAIYTSVATGVLPANGYIEFWGLRNDGKADKDLYFDPSLQLSDKLSLISDTAAYFLTVHTNTAANLRLQETINNVAGNTLPAEPYFIETLRQNFAEIVNRGAAQNAGEYLYLSRYDVGEMLSSYEIYPGAPRIITFNNLNLAAGGPVASISASIAGTAAFGTRPVEVQLNNVAVASGNLSSFGASIYSNSNIALSNLSSNTAQIKIVNNSSNASDRIVCGFIELNYPKQFNFGAEVNYSFSLPANGAGNFLQINYNHGGVAPVLYDMTNRRRYVADISTPNIVRFALLPSSVARELILTGQGAANIRNINSLQQKNFQNFSLTANQGNYIIISNALLNIQANGPVDQYRQYRNSAAGGSYVAKIYDIEELTDQFAFGIKKHPLSIKNFLRFARANFSGALNPKFCFMIGKGVMYDAARMAQNEPYTDRLNLVPTWGNPGSDVLLASANYDPVIATPIGRLSAVTPQEVSIYLQKVKEYELAQTSSLQTIANKAWMKNTVHVAGASDNFLSQLLESHLNGYKTINEDTLMGGRVYTFSKQTTGPVSTITNALMASLFQSGIGLFTYFGHGSSTTLDYNIDDPYNYNSTGKYPMFLMLGCNVGHIFTLDSSRFTILQTLSEKYVLADQKGGIGLIASSHFGLESYLANYGSKLYTSFGRSRYNRTITEVMQEVNQQMFINDFYTRMHLEQHLLHGDPAVKLNASTLPDFAVEEPQVAVSPSFLSVANTSFNVKTYFYNLGKATGDSVRVSFRHQYPDGTTAVVFQKRIKSVRNIDSVQFDIPIVPTRDRGQNYLIVTIDDDNKYSETTKSNNTITKSFFIFGNDIKPVYPYEYSIVNKQNIKLVGSTADPLAPASQYVMEIDTTELFNSPLKVTRNTTSSGGVVEFDPGISFGPDSTVYYWRIAQVPSSGPTRWNTSSFVFINNSSAGFNQSHFYQHTKSVAERLSIDSSSRLWKYGNGAVNFAIAHSIFGFSGSGNPTDYQISRNGEAIIKSACIGKSLIFNVFDPVGVKPLFNISSTTTPATQTTVAPNGGWMGSANTCDNAGGGAVSAHNFEFDYWSTTNRNKIRDFMDWIPNGHYVMVRCWIDDPFNTPYAPVWQLDGTNSLYNRLKTAGLSDIDSFYKPRTWVLVYRKNNNSFTPVQRFSAGLNDRINFNLDISFTDTLGYVTSPKFGPALNWKNLIWRGNRNEANGDNMNIGVIGVRANGQEDLLFNIPESQTNQNISSVSATTYPYIKLKMRNADSLNMTPYQLRYWTLTYDPVPEGALAPNLHYVFKDTLEAGENLNIGLAFKNISETNFNDSLKVRLTVTGSNNVTSAVQLPRIKRPAPGDTVRINTSIPTSSFTGNNTLYVDVNPDNDIQKLPEQTHINNFLFKNFVVKPDNINPLLDVTFDGVHILNGDIVSSKPHITVKLKDESKFLLLDDTSGATITLQYPDNSVRRFKYNTDTLRFTPAAAGGDNVATIDFLPILPQDGEYILTVKGKDKSGNTAGNLEYRVVFNVYNAPMITNMFNYPNPFTTSTAFVFTLTGSQLPSNIRIQILTVTGKIVREINKDELGPIHIGRNITDYKWDGTDQYGQKLANGVYLYRVITNLNGNSLEKFSTFDTNGDRVNTDKFFKGGYGKMYLMR